MNGHILKLVRIVANNKLVSCAKIGEATDDEISIKIILITLCDFVSVASRKFALPLILIALMKLEHKVISYQTVKIIFLCNMPLNKSLMMCYYIFYGYRYTGLLKRNSSLAAAFQKRKNNWS